MKYKQELPESQKDILVGALKTYREVLNTLKQTDDITYKNHDILVLIGLLKSDVIIELNPNEYDSFTQRNGVDFPIYK